MSRLLSCLALVAMLALIPLSAQSQVPEDWVAIETDQSTDGASFQVSGPDSWAQVGVSIPTGAEKIFADALGLPKSPGTVARSLEATAAGQGEYNGVDENLIDLSVDELKVLI